MFESFVLLSDYTHAPSANYEIIIACTVGKVTLLIENSKSLPYLQGKLGQCDIAVKCKTERERHPEEQKAIYS